MSTDTHMLRRCVIRRIRSNVLSMLCLCVATACSNLSSVLDVPNPTGVSTVDDLQDLAGVEARFNNAKSSLFYTLVGFNGLMLVSGRLADEFVTGEPSSAVGLQNIDARRTVGSGVPGAFPESGDNLVSSLLVARSELLLVIPALRAKEPVTEQRKVGEAYALVGYIETLLAEDYCAGVPLSYAKLGGGIVYEHPVSTDSLFAIAAAHFDSAFAAAHEDASIASLARVGLARAEMGRGHLTEAAAAAADVPTNFAYQIITPGNFGNFSPNFYRLGLPDAGCSLFNIGDREGSNGLPFVSGHDPRLVTDTTIGSTCSRLVGEAGAAPWYYPVRVGNPSTTLPFATGVEARLAEAEAALKSGQISTWKNDLNTLRADAPATFLQLNTSIAPLQDDSTTNAGTDARVDVMFRERAFWLFGMGIRLGDMRRLLRQYGRSANTVYPTGVYEEGAVPQLTTYGDDVSLTLPTLASGTRITNPYYQGCLTSPTTP